MVVPKGYGDKMYCKKVDESLIRRVILYCLVIFSGIFFVRILGLMITSKNTMYSDFIAFFTAAKMVASGVASQLYNLDIQASFQQKIIYPYRHELLPYFHPPFQIIAWLPLTIMPVRWAYWLWVIISLGIIIVSLIALNSYFRPKLREDQLIMWLTCFSFLPVVATFFLGQDSAISLLIFSLAFLYIKKGKEGKAGAILALNLFKPHLVSVISIILLFKRRWKALGCFFLVALFLTSLSLFMVGWQGVIDYIKLISEVVRWENQYGVSPSGMHNLRAFFYLIFGSDQRELLICSLILTTLGFLLLLFLIWKDEWRPFSHLFDLKFSLLIMVTILISPHLNTHDLTLWVIPGVLVANYLNQENPKIKDCILKALLPFGYMAGFLSPFYSKLLHFQISVVFMGITVGLLACEILLIKRDKAIS